MSLGAKQATSTANINVFESITTLYKELVNLTTHAPLAFVQEQSAMVANV